QGQRAAQLVRQILDFSRQTVAERKPLDLVPILKENLKLLDRTLPENIEVRSEFGRDASVVEANPTQIQQVLTNLAVNARDAMPDGGKFDLELSSLEVKRGEATPLPGMKEGRYVVWTVSDSGTGIPPDVIEHIFEPFYTTKNPGDGTGLGLAQVYGIVQQHRGEIDVESKAGERTRFRIYLPAVSVPGQAETTDPADLPRGQGETILLVEDQAEVLEVTRSMLQSLNYRVLTAGNGEEGVEVYRANRESISLVLTDMVMPELNGLDMLMVLKEEDPTVRTVMMSGYSMDEDGEARVPTGAEARMEKPLSVETLAQVVREVLDRDPMDPNGGDGR
ncbi:MAG: ATP-binding protein, partial [Candidatus Latescibacteria bacterium]|nr:ATP-binding protein [Candidatus Latescibacterota bacterium]